MRDHGRLLSVTITVCVSCLLLLNVTTVWYVKQQSDRRRDDLIRSCERGNIIRAELNVIVRALNLGFAPLPVVDCNTTIN